MGFWDFDHDSFVWLYLPIRRRKAKMVAWLRALVNPAKYIFGLLKAYRTDKQYVLNHTGQVCRLEGVLNDAFDYAPRRIFISDPAYIDPVYTYQRAELKPWYLYQRSENMPVYLYQRSECYDGAGVQFTVNVPAAVYGAIDLNRMRALIDKYRLAGKTNYTIVSF